MRGWIVGWIAASGCSEQALVHQNEAPVVAITSHRDGDSVPVGVPTLLVGTVTDDLDESAELEVWWFLDERLACSDPLSFDGTSYCSAVFEAAAEVFLEARDHEGKKGSTSIRLVLAGPGSDTDDSDTDGDSDFPSDTDSAFDTETIVPVDTDTDLPVDSDTDSPADTDTDPLVDTDTDALVDTDTDPLVDTDTVPLVDTDSDPVDTDTDLPIDTDSDAPVDTDSDVPVDTDTDPPVDTSAPLPPQTYTHCQLPAIYERVVHTQGNVDLTRVAYHPAGDYALILGYSSELWRYDPSTDAIAFVASGGDEYWEALAFSEDGSFALVGGGDSWTAPDPVLYAYTESGGLQALTGVPGLFSPMRIQDIAVRPGTSTYTLLSDNAAGYPAEVTYLHEFDPDLTNVAHQVTYGGGHSSDQGASSVAWGENLGLPMALAVDRYLELFTYDPNMAPTGLTVQTGVNTGNLKKVIFEPGLQVAWVLQWSGSGKVYTWESVLRNDYANSYGFTGWGIWDFTTSPDGYWKLFIGRNASITWSNSAWRPLDHAAFVSQPIPSFDQPPWSGTSNDYLTNAAWRPGTCEGLIVGDATSSQGTVAKFTLAASP